MKKRFLATLMIVAMSASMLAGCGSKSDAPADSAAKDDAAATDDAAKDDAAATDDAAAEGAQKLTVWCWDPAFNIYAMETAAKYYQKDHPDVEVEVVETPWDDIQPLITNAASTGEYSQLPDILLMQDNAFQKNAISYPDLFVDLTDSGIDFSQFAAGKLGYSTVGGKNYGVPFDNGAVIACYRTDILEQAGYTIDDLTDITWSRFEEISSDVQAKTGYYLLSERTGEIDLIMMMLQSAGASMFDESGAPVIADNAALKNVVETFNSLVANNALLLTQQNWDEYIKSFNSGSAAGVVNGCWIMGSIQAAADQSGKWAITNMPKLDGIDGATNYSNNGGSSWAVTTNCKNVELATDFLNSTFCGSVDFYGEILPSSGAIATWAPAAEADVYGEPSEFFGGDAVFKKVVDFSTKTPANNTGVYYYEARNAVATAITNIQNGGNIDDELANAQATVEAQMQ
ncbi:MAG: extracellular solute-binding protein [Eubacterium sp.]|nr:extracellular solute-binding protein [Eubacterium sp.]